VMKCDADLDHQKTSESGHVEFAGKALVQIVSSLMSAVSAFIQSVVVYLVNCRMWLFRCKKCVDGQLFPSCGQEEDTD